MKFDNMVNKILKESDWHFKDSGKIRDIAYSQTERGREKGHDPEGDRYNAMMEAAFMKRLAVATADINRAKGNRPFTRNEIRSILRDFRNKSGGVYYGMAVRDPDLREVFTRATGVVQPGYEEEGIKKAVGFVIRNKKTGRIMNDRNDKSKYAKFTDANHARNVIGKFKFNQQDLEPVDGKTLSPEEQAKIAS